MNTPKTVLILLLGFLTSGLCAQNITQTVRGTVTDKVSGSPIFAATVEIGEGENALGTQTDENGNFRIEEVPIGRHRVWVSFFGYKEIEVQNFLVTSAKEAIFNIALEEEAFKLETTEITAEENKKEANNKMATVSARSFTVEETRRYAGGFDDPARMASAFAGVNGPSDVSDNSIVIRGNSPKGILWRMEGVDIPNPNHFSDVGTSGGGVSILSNQVMDNSDFYTGAFPANFGNATSGAFDIKMRRGNNEKYEHSFQIAALGVDALSEGPLAKNYNGSYLINYRYSTFDLLSQVMDIFGDEIPRYQDLSYKIHLPAGKAGNFSLWGLGGKSASNVGVKLDSTTWLSESDRYGWVYENRMGAAGLNHNLLLGKKAYLRTSLAGTYKDFTESEEFVKDDLSARLFYDQSVAYSKITGSSFVNLKLNSKHTNRTGFILSQNFYKASAMERGEDSGQWEVYLADSGQTFTSQFYTNSTIHLQQNLVANLGVHLTHFGLNNELSPEPRIGLKYQFHPRNAVSIGYGMHSKIEDISTYLIGVPGGMGGTGQPNKDLKMAKAHHFVLAYDHDFNQNLRVKVEGYYQDLFDVPVSYHGASSINAVGFVAADSLFNEGEGRNVGVDITFERFFNDSYYFLVTTSLYDSRYTDFDGTERETRYDGGWTINALGGKEFYLGKQDRNILGLNLRAQFAGGNRYTPIDLEASKLAGSGVLASQPWSAKFPNYQIVDFTTTYRINQPRFSHVMALQLKNLLNIEPIGGYFYDAELEEVREWTSTGLIPNISYKLEF